MLIRKERQTKGFVLLLTALLAPILYGHAILVSATPEANQVVNGPNVPVRLRFNSRIDFKRSRMTLIAADGAQTPVSIEEQTSPNLVIGQAQGLKPGAYVIRWQVLAVDGHITRGELPFRVH